MRVTRTRYGVTVKAYAGATGVLLAMDIKGKPADDFLGFAIERSSPTGRTVWLSGMLPFPHMRSYPGRQIASNVAPIQKFRWSDYAVHPDSQYKYIVHPVFGDPKNPVIRRGPSVTVNTASATTGKHVVLFNRAAGASQAFARKFPTLNYVLTRTKKNDKLTVPILPETLVWLSRGLKEMIIQYIETAKDSSWALDVAIYQHELDDITSAVTVAHKRGAGVRVVYHARNKDKQTAKNIESLRHLPDACKRGRETHGIFHHKFIVLSRIVDGVKRPYAVLTGSTNFTHNAVYKQANVAHIIRDAKVAGIYLQLFDVLFSGATVPATKAFVNTHNTLSTKEELIIAFTPRSGGGDLADFVKRIDGAENDVLFCTAFSLHRDISEALKGKTRDDILRYGVQDKRSEITGYHRDRSTHFTAAAMLSEGLDGFLRESLKGAGGAGNILIHTKVIVVDFTSSSPTVISGSHNYSAAASKSNDENVLIIHGNTDLADVYGIEVMRIYDHYRFRFRSKEDKPAGKRRRRLTLKPDGSWARRYFEKGTLEWRDRLLFARGKA